LDPCGGGAEGAEEEAEGGAGRSRGGGGYPEGWGAEGDWASQEDGGEMGGVRPMINNFAARIGIGDSAAAERSAAARDGGRGDNGGDKWRARMPPAG